jgi:hypothetical protein
MNSCCSVPPISTSVLPIEVPPVEAQCGGSWIGQRGGGIHHVKIPLGNVDLESIVTVWYKRRYVDDTISVYQLGSMLAISADDSQIDGSFTFTYSDMSGTEGADYVILEIVNQPYLKHVTKLCETDNQKYQ